VLGRPGGDLLSQVLRHSTIGAEVFDGRVRDGIGSDHLAKATRPAKDKKNAEAITGVYLVVLRAITCVLSAAAPLALWRDEPSLFPEERRSMDIDK
jgi:hypothetical protein